MQLLYTTTQINTRREAQNRIVYLLSWADVITLLFRRRIDITIETAPDVNNADAPKLLWVGVYAGGTDRGTEK